MDMLTFDIQRFASEEALDTLNTVSDIVITGTNYSDRINNQGTGITVNALGGDDHVTNSSASVSVDLGDGNDELTN